MFIPKLILLFLNSTMELWMYFNLSYLYISTVSNKGPNPHHRNLVLVLSYTHFCLYLLVDKNIEPKSVKLRNKNNYDTRPK